VDCFVVDTECLECCVCLRVKTAQAVLIALYDLNPEEFMVMLSVLPKTFQVRWPYTTT